MTKAKHLPLPLFALLALAGCNAPDPDDYGGGAMGETIAKCVTKTERADSNVTREQAGELCTCVTEKITSYAKSAVSGGGAVSKGAMERAFVGCAKKAGVEITD